MNRSHFIIQMHKRTQHTHTQVDTLHAWNGAAALRAYRRHAEQKIAATARARLLRGVLLPWRLEVRVTAFAEGWKAHHIRFVHVNEIVSTGIMCV